MAQRPKSMITYYCRTPSGLRREHAKQLSQLPEHVLWIDLLRPTLEEERFVENSLGVVIPTPEEMAEIEESSRFYENEGVLYMTPLVVRGIGEGQPELTDLFFIFNGSCLVTVHYTETSTFRSFPTKLTRQPERHTTSDMILVSLLDGFIDRIADVLEEQQRALDQLSRRIFTDPQKVQKGKTDLQQVIKHLGRHQALLAKLDDSLLSFTRMGIYLRQSASHRLSAPSRNGLKAVGRDIHSLNSYQARMSGQITFLLDATLGLINIEQNSTMRVLSVAAVLFLPPTLVGTVYGMNFRHMPELEWGLGYPLAVGLMLSSALVSLLVFRHKGWL